MPANDETPEALANRYVPGSEWIPFQTKSGATGVRSVDQRTIAIEIHRDVLDGDSAAIIRYELGPDRTVEFLRTFEMMVNTVTFTKFEEDL